MIQGIVTPNRQARIRFTVFSSGRQQYAVDALVDTGFNIFLTLPASTSAALALPFALRTQASLADGSLVQLDCYRATVDWDGQPRAILVVSADGGPLAGMSWLSGSRVTLDVVDGGPVTIEPLP
jgi:predicted aspartyl protease